jgi:hypothetical protein
VCVSEKTLPRLSGDGFEQAAENPDVDGQEGIPISNGAVKIIWRANVFDGIMDFVKTKSLFEDSGFSKNPEAYGRFLVDTVVASTSIEIGPVPKKMLRQLREHSNSPQKIRIRK